ncbi:MAG: type II toxin-antitoxin system PemK/MazF family toxin [Saprospiraceae bacterium]|nr:type II toxin-antitoxin system PemK/MazF family toxin [Saprospiraceae bacterium]
MKFKRFEIWLADLNPRFGTEAGKTRPVLIVQTNLLNKVHPSTVICPITTNIKEGVNILRVNILKGEGSMEKDCSIMIDQIRAIDNKRFVKKIGNLPEPLQKKVIENIKIVLEISTGH